MGWPRAVVFDLDGTLIDSGPDLARLLNIVLGEYGRSEVGLDRVRGFVGDGIAKLVERGLEATGGSTETQRRSATDRFLAIYEAEPALLTRPYPGVPATLKQLKEEGRLLGDDRRQRARRRHGECGGCLLRVGDVRLRAGAARLASDRGPGRSVRRAARGLGTPRCPVAGVTA